MIEIPPCTEFNLVYFTSNSIESYIIYKLYECANSESFKKRQKGLY